MSDADWDSTWWIGRVEGFDAVPGFDLERLW
jgi:hypothetical protein